MNNLNKDLLFLGLGIALFTPISISNVHANSNVSNNSNITHADNNSSENSLTKDNQGNYTYNTYFNNNKAYSHEKNNFTNVNGFLTPNSWYRPKFIHDNGKTWKKSNSNEFRPILMSWGPDKQTEVNYLNYMSDNGYSNKIYSINTSNIDIQNGYSEIQDNIEHKISSKHSVEWLKNLISNFVAAQPQWNNASEHLNIGPGNLQGGSLLFKNDKLTPWSNSDYREIGRFGYGDNRFHNNTNNYELLLGNDIDNSNPSVQAENVNWLYYLMNSGSILNNNKQGNFDGIREDATGSMDYDVTDIESNYLDNAFHMSNNDRNANAHLNLLEDGINGSVDAVNHNNNKALTQNFDTKNDFTYILTLPSDQRSPLSNFTNTDRVSRVDNYTENKATPNYSFVNTHDDTPTTSISSLFDYISKNDKNMSDQKALIKATNIYDNDKFKTDKKYTKYNVPSSYAMLLNDKDVVPRVYYGDLYLEGSQYMTKKTPYFGAISTLLKARQQYVSGGQQLRQHGNDLLSSVRFGKGIMNPNDKGNKESRTEGMATVISNNPNLQNNNEIKIDMGIAHKNQAYRPVLSSTDKGINNYNSDEQAKKLVRHTNDQGQLVLKTSDIKGVSNPQVSGYLSAWVPVGAKDNQDARTQASSKNSTDGKVYHSNAALDSHVIFEGFSSFLPTPNSNSNRADVKLARNANVFKGLGITDFEFPPHYVPLTNDDSFIDATARNGYAFPDRYNLGLNGETTKYGNAKQLSDANAAMHQQGIHTLVDYVPNQIYNLTGEEVVSATRTDGYGKENSVFGNQNQLYDAHSIGGGQYQNKYGGNYIKELKNKYPSLFNEEQASTGKKIDSNSNIKQWSAKYLNGTNVQKNGTDYVLSDNNKQYFTVGNKSYLPDQLK